LRPSLRTAECRADENDRKSET